MDSIKLEFWLDTKVMRINLGALSFMEVDLNWKLPNSRAAFAFLVQSFQAGDLFSLLRNLLFRRR